MTALLCCYTILGGNGYQGYYSLDLLKPEQSVYEGPLDDLDKIAEAILKTSRLPIEGKDIDFKDVFEFPGVGKVFPIIEKKTGKKLAALTYFEDEENLKKALDNT